MPAAATASPSDRLALDGGPPLVQPPLTWQAHGAAEMGREELAAVEKVIANAGKVWRYSHDAEHSTVSRCEARYRELTGAPYALVVGSGGTGALIAGLVGLGIGPGDEVIIPGYTYVATASAVICVGAVPVLAEVDASLTLDPADVAARITPRTRALLPVHMRGTPCRMAELLDLARAHKLVVLEDVAQANGATYRGRWCGTLGDAGAFSFQYYKMITAGEGGMLLTRDRTVFERACMQHDSALQFWEKGQTSGASSIEPFAGENYRMSEINGAILEVQIARLPGLLARLREVKRQMMAGVTLRALAWQDVPDPAGDAATHLTLLARDPAEARWVAQALQAEGAAAGTIFDKTIPDRHVYRCWDYVLRKIARGADGRPWADPAYVQAGGAIRYAEDCLPRTLALLERTVSLPIHQQVSAATARGVAQALARIEARLAGSGR